VKGFRLESITGIEWSDRHRLLAFLTGGSATELSATDAWLRAVVGDELI
jgi:hypothetical protein